MERFNYWIKSRVQNRRFPESTVVETFGLYELGFHLQITQQLPTGATVNVSVCADNEDTSPIKDETEMSDDHESLQVQPKGYPSIIDHDQVTQLNMKTYPEYGNLVRWYELEKKTAQVGNQFPLLQDWVSCDGEPLSEVETILCKGPDNNVTKYKVYGLKNNHNKLIRYDRNMSTRSMYRRMYTLHQVVVPLGDYILNIISTRFILLRRCIGIVILP